jgi:hypothetical protein
MLDAGGAATLEQKLFHSDNANCRPVAGELLFLPRLLRILRLLKHQILILNRSRKRSPNLHASDRILAGLMALLVRPTRLLRSANVVKPSTLLALHKALSKGKYRMLFSADLPLGATEVRHAGRYRT